MCRGPVTKLSLYANLQLAEKRDDLNKRLTDVTRFTAEKKLDEQQIDDSFRFFAQIGELIRFDILVNKLVRGIQQGVDFAPGRHEPIAVKTFHEGQRLISPLAFWLELESGVQFY